MRRPSRHRVWHGFALRLRSQSGIMMAYFILMMQLLTLVTASVMLLIAADSTSGIQEMNAIKVFNVAESGAHYAISNMLPSSASAGSYSGETVSIVDGTTALGTATVTVRCMDGQTPLSGGQGCPDLLAPFRKITSTGALPVGGSQRRVTAVVQGIPITGANTKVLCGYTSVTFSAGAKVYGDVAAGAQSTGSDPNPPAGTILLTGPSDNISQVRRDAPEPYTNWGYYNGDARATGSITCSLSCATQVQGTVTANLPKANGPCGPRLTFAGGYFNPGSSDLPWVDGYTMNDSTGYRWRDVVIPAGDTGLGSCNSYTTLNIDTGTRTTTKVVQIRQLKMGACARVVLQGDGKVDLRASDTRAGQQAISVGQYGRLVVLSTDTLATPKPAPAARLTASVQSTGELTGSEAIKFDRATVIAGSFRAPAGLIKLDRLLDGVPQSVGFLVANKLDLSLNMVYTYDPSVAQYGQLGKLRSWKDQ